MTRKHTADEAILAHEKARNRIRAWRRKRRESRADQHRSNHRASIVDVPPDVEADRARALAYVPFDLTAAINGDPPPWRSALRLRDLADVQGGGKSGRE